jgi:2-phospho-L-lactate/phosphoenolpyruvate guanylyltransferase
VIRVVIPYAGSLGKTRLALESSEREKLSIAMLAGVLSVALEVGRAWVVSPDEPEGSDATWIPDPGGGQGAAVAGALLEIGPGPVLVVNADLPLLSADDLLALAAATPEPGIAIAAAADGTTNALGLSDTTLFAPLYGRESAARFRAHAESSGVAAVDVARPGLRNDVDTLADLVNA